MASSTSSTSSTRSTSSTTKKAEAEERAERDEDKEAAARGETPRGRDTDSPTVSQPVHSNLLPVTAPDYMGVERVVSPGDDNWTPAESDPDEDAVTRNEERFSAIKDAQKERLEELKGRTDDQGADHEPGSPL